VHAGQGLTDANGGPVGALPSVEELSTGQSVVSRSVFVGIERAVREMKEIVIGAPARARRPDEWVPPIGF